MWDSSIWITHTSCVTDAFCIYSGELFWVCEKNKLIKGRCRYQETNRQRKWEWGGIRCVRDNRAVCTHVWMAVPQQLVEDVAKFPAEHCIAGKGQAVDCKPECVSPLLMMRAQYAWWIQQSRTKSLHLWIILIQMLHNQMLITSKWPNTGRLIGLSSILVASK